MRIYGLTRIHSLIRIHGLTRIHGLIRIHRLTGIHSLIRIHGQVCIQMPGTIPIRLQLKKKRQLHLNTGIRSTALCRVRTGR